MSIEKDNNFKNRLNNFKQSRLAKGLLYSSVAVGLGMLIPEFALATSKFDIDAGITGGTKPLIDGLKAHWGKAVLLSGGVSAFLGEGDARQKAIRAGIGCFASGGLVLALISMLT